MSSTVEQDALLDSIALNDAAKSAGITYEQARRFAAALGELPGAQQSRITGQAAMQAQCGRMRARRIGR